jgi:predicted NBD/HSP70 family sugar kinase
MITGNKGLIRDINSRLVLETIINSKFISRAALSKKLGLTKATISAIVQDLINNNLVTEIGSDDTTLGRKPILLSFNRNAGYVICVDLGEDTISVLKTDLLGEDRTLKRIKKPKCELIIQAITDLIETMIQDFRKTPYGLVGLSLGVYGSVDEPNVIYDTSNTICVTNIAMELERQLQTPVYLYKDSALSVFAEKIYAYDASNLVEICFATQVRLGILIQNEIYTGFQGRAGEIGHMVVEPGGKACTCGNFGCYNQYLSETILLKEYAEKRGIADIGMETFLSHYEAGVPESILMVDTFTKYLSLCIHNVICTYNPEVIILNSNLTNALPSIISRAKESLNKQGYNNISLVPSTLHKSSVLLGGTNIAVKNFLSISNLRLPN